MLLCVAPFGCQTVDPCREGQATPAVEPLQSTTDAGLLLHAHAHNDYEHPHPLQDALDAGFRSVEADVYFANGKFEVKHSSIELAKGTLEDLYLAPLQQKVSAQGSVFGDGVQFTLWVDLKDNASPFVEGLGALLSRFPMLTRIDSDGVKDGPVVVVLTGNASAKKNYGDSPTPRYAFRDSNDFSVEDPPADSSWRYYALDWGKYIPWGGGGTPSAEAQRHMACLISNAHEKGRQVRMWSIPDNQNVWKTLTQDGYDFIGTDHLTELSAFLRSQ